MKFAEYLCEKLKQEENYTHCYFVAGGNIMHLLDAARTRFVCIPVVNEVAAGIAAEYFNEANTKGEKAFVLVTAGPGLTNIVTAVAGAYLESRELLVIGGQVKRDDLKSANMRQRGIQEIDGRSIVAPITNEAVTLSDPWEFERVRHLLHTYTRPAPIFLEIPLDVQAARISFLDEEQLGNSELKLSLSENRELDDFVTEVLACLESSSRPVILLGGGVSRAGARLVNNLLQECGIPIMTTWNGADRYGHDQPNYWGRPNTWGQRGANILIQQSDCLVAIGTRLGIQQTGFAWTEFAPLAKIFQVDIDRVELEKGHPKIYLGLAADGTHFLKEFLNRYGSQKRSFTDWLEFGQSVREAFPLNDVNNQTSEGYIDPFNFVLALGSSLRSDDVVIPCSSGGAFTVTMQAFNAKFGQTVISNKGLASMGYGLAGALGAAKSTGARTVLIEGDGGFAQNLQELGTVRESNLNLKIFIFANNGYASIRMTQRNYFDGAYLGCDIDTGLGMPKWEYIALAYQLPFYKLTAGDSLELELNRILSEVGPSFTLVDIDPEQTYYPKITSRVLPDGKMASNPLHFMTPDLTPEQIDLFLPYLKDTIQPLDLKAEP